MLWHHPPQLHSRYHQRFPPKIARHPTSLVGVCTSFDVIDDKKAIKKMVRDEQDIAQSDDGTAWCCPLIYSGDECTLLLLLFLACRNNP
jgi:hypothetical protein